MALNGSRAKLSRAKHHLDDLEAQIDRFLQTYPHGVTAERPTSNLEWLVRLIDAPALPVNDWAPIVGDCVHNIRAALDYIAWELAGRNPSDRATQFPIFDSQGEWDKSASRRIRCLPLPPIQIRTLIYKLQPLHARNPSQTPLSALRQLDDSDKHQLLTVTAAMQERISVEFSTSIRDWVAEPAITVRPRVTLKEGTILGSVTLSQAPSDVEMKSDIAVYVAFGDGFAFGNDVAIAPSLRTIIRGVSASLS